MNSSWRAWVSSRDGAPHKRIDAEAPRWTSTSPRRRWGQGLASRSRVRKRAGPESSEARPAALPSCSAERVGSFRARFKALLLEELILDALRASVGAACPRPRRVAHMAAHLGRNRRPRASDSNPKRSSLLMHILFVLPMRESTSHEWTGAIATITRHLARVNWKSRATASRSSPRMTVGRSMPRVAPYATLGTMVHTRSCERRGPALARANMDVAQLHVPGSHAAASTTR